MNDKELKDPVHARITADLRRRLAAGEWSPGAMLPARGDLAGTYGVALGTLQRAIKPLLDEGLLRAEDKRGTFVAATGAARAQPLIALVAWEPHMGGGQGVDEPWTATVIGAVERHVAQAGGRTLLFNVDVVRDAFQDPRAALAAAAAAAPDALIVVDLVYMPGWPAAAVAAWGGRAGPLVYVGGGEAPGTGAQLDYDQHAAGVGAARHLLGAGYRRCAFIGPTTDAWSESRAEGASTALRAAGAAPLQRTPGSGDYRTFLAATAEVRAAAVRRQVAAALAAGCDGLIAANDAIALLCLEELGLRGLESGSAIGVIGFDGDRAARVAGISSVTPPLLEFGEQAARLALAPGLPTRLLLRGQVLARSTTWRARPRAHADPTQP